ncbi:diapause bioclock protein [Danaus plexippus plexippus]|uniref:Superoxide dismutase [Cu-Zn] n=2 Tax=Danaus plexippus TaxID=13037 RepID=A0A212F790_DANPL|nr:diapause bioclock protein [Danaus plexippus plexippus]
MLYHLLFLSVAGVIVSAQNVGNAPLRAIVKLSSPDGRDVHGNITLTQLEGRVHVEGSIYGLPPGQYGFHVHETGDITRGCISTGSHFNPEKKDHGHPSDEVRHVGDLGNVEFDMNRFSNINFEDKLIALYGPHNVLGRAIVLHEKADDFGRSDHPDSRKTGNAGGRVACGVIGIL